ncbi:hypothetical protein [Sulfobacillus harzensis]|uniref:Uncharacterized protein n=1 Tax=Sulfobacillus harzensis TaxID=2729629 RepID=A0A7Y0L6S0_9FIRM|nr:hypothetical protein [Sulfobacillus harzensis]NMP23475.1 hypothetical protein [Sulfobacillus harzensis]
MSTARAHIKDSKHGASGDHAEKKGHPFRNALLISLALAALILWQLNPIIQGLHSTATALSHAESFRQVVIGLVNMGYHRALDAITPLIHRVSR